MDQVGLFCFQDRLEPADEGQVQIAGHRQRDHQAVCWGVIGDRAVIGTNQHICDAQPAQAVDQVEDLLRAAPQVPAGFYMQYFHGRGPERPGASSRQCRSTSPTTRFFMQVYAPLQVGRLRHGAQWIS